MFYVIEGKRQNKNKKKYKGSFVLIHDNWNDYWKFKTQYYLIYINENGEEFEFGEVKIGSKDESCVPPLPDSFDSLDNNFFSLGQSEIYYKSIIDCLEYLPENPFICLNDMANNLNIFKENRDKYIMGISLLRGLSESVVVNQFNRISNFGAVLTPYNFTYVFNKDFSDLESEKNRMEFNVEVDSYPPSNIHILIGRNSVGKTKILTSMVECFLSPNNNLGYFELDDEKVDNPYDLFPNLIYMSYSAFDDTIFVENQKNDISGNKYVYLGLRKVQTDKIKSNEKNYFTKSLSDLSYEFAESIKECNASLQKRKRLINSLEILESDPIFRMVGITKLIKSSENNQDKNNEECIIDKDYNSEINKIFKNLSTGHRVILLTITKLVETIEEKSLILLDEPETHLHPPLLSSFVRALSNLVVDRNAVTIVATHSPVILQEVPKNCVWKLKRSGSICNISRPRMETFGESYSILVEDVFGLEIEHSGFHQLLKEQVDKLQSFEELEEKFNYQLGKDANIIARTLFLQKKSREENGSEDK